MGACWDACPALTALTPPNSFCGHQKTSLSFLPRWSYLWNSFGYGLFSFQSDPAGSSWWPTTGPQETCISVPSAAAKALTIPNFVTFISFANRQAASAMDCLLYVFSSWVTHQFHFSLEHIKLSAEFSESWTWDEEEGPQPYNCKEGMPLHLTFSKKMSPYFQILLNLNLNLL